MPEEITFTTAAFGGFEKKQVLDYILKMHEELDKDKNKQRKKLEDISYAFKELEQRAIGAEREKEMVQQKLDATSFALQNEKSRSENLRLSQQEIQQKLEQAERILAQRKKQEDSHVEIPPEPSYATPEQISYDHSAQIGKVMLDAHSKANRIVEDAKGEAIQILGEARRNLDVRMKQNDAYLKQYAATKEEEAKEAISVLQNRAYSQISGIYDYLDSLIASLISTADDSKSQFSSLGNQVSKIRAAWRSGNPSTTPATPLTTPSPSPPPAPTPPPPKPEAPPVNLDDYKLSDKYSSLFEYEPNVIEKPRIEYSHDYPYNSEFPEASPKPISTPTPLPDYPPLEHEPLSPQPPAPKSDEGYIPYYASEVVNNPPAPAPPPPPMPPQPIFSGAEHNHKPEQPYAYPHSDSYETVAGNLAEDEIAPDKNMANKRSLVFNFEPARPEDLSSSLDSDEITFPSLHPVDFSQPPSEND